MCGTSINSSTWDASCPTPKISDTTRRTLHFLRLGDPYSSSTFETVSGRGSILTLKINMGLQLRKTCGCFFGIIG